MIEAGLVVLGAILAKLAEWLIDFIRQNRAQKAITTMVGAEEVLEWGWDGAALLKVLIKLDHELIGSDLNEEREGTVSQWAPVFMSHTESWKLLVKGPKNIVGYWAVAALNETQFSRAYAGELLDSEITVDVIDPLDVPGSYNLYFVLLAVRPTVPRGGEILRDSFFAELQRLANQGVFFKSICANAFTAAGVRVCKGFGMTRVGPHKDFGEVYWMPLHPWPAKLQHRAELKKAYEVHYSVHPAPMPPAPLVGQGSPSST